MTGPDFLALQVPDPEASAAFWTDVVGLERSPQQRPGAVVFDTRPIPFALRVPLGDLPDPVGRGHGVSLWFAVPDVDALHDRLASAGAKVLSAPAPGPFGRMLTFRDPDGYAVTAHDAS